MPSVAALQLLPAEDDATAPGVQCPTDSVTTDLTRTTGTELPSWFNR
jgi:hypothetical protein